MKSFAVALPGTTIGFTKAAWTFVFKAYYVQMCFFFKIHVDVPVTESKLKESYTRR